MPQMRLKTSGATGNFIQHYHLEEELALLLERKEAVSSVRGGRVLIFSNSSWEPLSWIESE